MPLFLSLLVDSMQDQADLFSIVRCDGGLGIGAATPKCRASHTIKPLQGLDKTEAIVGLATNIVISAAPAGTQIPDGAGGLIPIELVAGATFPPDANGIIQVAYCFDTQFFAFNTGGTQISFP